MVGVFVLFLHQSSVSKEVRLSVSSKLFLFLIVKLKKIVISVLIVHFIVEQLFAFVICHKVWNDRNANAVVRNQRVKLKTNLELGCMQKSTEGK